MVGFRRFDILIFRSNTIETTGKFTVDENRFLQYELAFKFATMLLVMNLEIICFTKNEEIAIRIFEHVNI